MNSFGSSSNTLWLGDVQIDTDEETIRDAFYHKGHIILGAKVFSGKTGNGGYAFVIFENHSKAANAFVSLQGDTYPNHPYKRFKLGWANYTKLTPIVCDTTNNTTSPLQQPQAQTKEVEKSVYVGDLSEDVTDNTMLDFFCNHFASIKTAKIVCDKDTGAHKGYGFISFYNEIDKQTCLSNMNGVSGLGSKPIRICDAIQKPRNTLLHASTNSHQANDNSCTNDPSNTNSEDDTKESQMTAQQQQILMMMYSNPYYYSTMQEYMSSLKTNDSN